MVKTEQIREWSNQYRLVQPEAVRSMELSMRTTGQQQPLILLKNDDGYHIIDGIKRYRAALEIGLVELQSLILEVDVVMAKAMILHYNRHSSSLSMYEQGLIVCSLIHDHRLSQREVARVLKAKGTQETGYIYSHCREAVAAEKRPHCGSQRVIGPEGALLYPRHPQGHPPCPGSRVL